MANRNITYQRQISKNEIGNILKSILAPIGVFFLALFVISQFGLFGRNIIAPACCTVWILGIVVAFWIPSQRASTLKEVYIMIAGYCAGLYVVRILIAIAANTSSEQLMASYNMPLPASTGATISGYLQSLIWILAFVTPITFLGALGKKLVTYRRTASKQQTIRQLRGNIRP